MRAVKIIEVVLFAIVAALTGGGFGAIFAVIAIGIFGGK